MLQVTSTILIPEEEFEFTYARSSGPGGQNVNKVNSKAILRWNPTTSPSLPDGVRTRFLAKYRSKLTTEGELLIQSQKTRDQEKNVEDCREKLRELIAAVAVAPKPRKKTKPSKGSIRRRLADKKANSERKQGRRTEGFAE